jgi:NADH dehydrogenase
MPPTSTAKAQKATFSPEQALALADMADELRRGPKRVVVLGGGFAGVYTAKRLTELLGRRTDIEVELLSEENYFVFQPLLPEVAAGGIAATHVVNPIREIVPRARFRCCRIRHVDLPRRRVLVSQGEARELISVPYDHIVFCVGKVSDFSALPGVAEHALAMKDLGDAFALRNHVLRCLELADIERDAAQKRALLTFVVAGGGFSGVETAGELHELVTRTLRYFPRIARDEIAFRLVHSQQTLLPEMPKELGEAARTILERRGIEMVLGARVAAASPGRVHLSGGKVIETRTFVCTVGNAPNPIVKHLLRKGELPEAEAKGKKMGLIAVDRTLRCAGADGCWAVGDCAAIPSPSGQGLCPPTAQFAIREAATCAENILAAIDGRPARPFAFKALGMLASLGQRRAVAQLFGLKLTGFFAWFLWRTVYLGKLPGFARKLRVALDWTLDLFFQRDITQLDVGHAGRVRRSHYEPGEMVVRKGEIGREFFLITAGEVEVLAPDGDGVVARLGAKDFFGERALLEDTRRNATVRAATPVDVLVISRNDFRSMVASFPVLEEHFAKILKERHPEAMGERTLLESVAPEGPSNAEARPAPAEPARLPATPPGPP